MSNTQDQPMQDGNHATNDEKVQGIIGQVRADVDLGNVDDARTLLQQRLADAGLELPADEFEKVLESVTGGN
jgi:hypothetical protein